MKRVIAYTDGSCNAKNGKGGFGSYMEIHNPDNSFSTSTISRGFFNTKTGRMELGAVISALSYCLEIDNVVSIKIMSDSQYVVNTINKGWYRGWAISNFRNIKNRDLIEALVILYEYIMDELRIKVEFEWVKGHSGVFGNEVADSLAREGYRLPDEQLTDDNFNNDNGSGGFVNW